MGVTRAHLKVLIGDKDQQCLSRVLLIAKFVKREKNGLSELTVSKMRSKTGLQERGRERQRTFAAC